jgi:exodeoxyribonuclease VII small subunit
VALDRFATLAMTVAAFSPPSLDPSFPPDHKRPMADDPIAELSFEDALKRLEEIVRQLESGDVPLEESIRLYQEGDRLRSQCETRLKSAQAKIDQIQLGGDGQPAAVRAFDAD